MDIAALTASFTADQDYRAYINNRRALRALAALIGIMCAGLAYGAAAIHQISAMFIFAVAAVAFGLIAALGAPAGKHSKARKNVWLIEYMIGSALIALVGFAPLLRAAQNLLS